MHLLAHNALQCPASGGYPLTIMPTATASAAAVAGGKGDAVKTATSHRALLLTMLPRLDWPALLSAARDVGRADGLPAAAPASAEAAGEPLLAQLQALLLELEITEGELHSPCGRHRYAIHDGIANMVVDLTARAGSAATRMHGGADSVAAAGTAVAKAAAAAPVELDADGVPVHRLYRRREKVEVCVMQGDAEPGGEKLQAEAAKLAPAITRLAQARQAGRISDAECVGGFLLVYLQERHSKSWLCGPRNGANAHRMAFAAAEASDGERPAKRPATAADGPESGLAIEQVPGLTLSEYHRNKLLGGGRRQQPSKKQRADATAEDGAADKDAAAAAQPAPVVVPISLLDLFAGWQLASVPNYASRALISWAGQPDGGRTPTTALSFHRPSPASHLSLHASGGRYVTLRLADNTAPTDLNSPSAGTSPDVVLVVETALGSVVCGRDPFELILHELKLLDVAMGNARKRKEWVGFCLALHGGAGLGPALRDAWDATWCWDWERIVGEMAVSQRPEHTLGYMKARLMAAFFRARDGTESPAPASGGAAEQMAHGIGGGTRHYLSREVQDAFNTRVWYGALAGLGLEKGTAEYVAGVRLGSEEYVPDADIPAIRQAFEQRGSAS